MANCTKIVFSNRACNAIVGETIDKIPTETGGILLGKIIGSTWHVVESIDPGPNSIFTVVYFEYDTAYVNHLAKVLSRQYFMELEVLGLWHRHPGSMDTFSGTDDRTNTTFARMNAKGSISGIVNIDPTMRLTMYHVSFPLHYEKINFEVADHLFPENLFKYKHTEEIRMINLHQHCLPYISRNTLPDFHKINSLPKNFLSFISLIRHYYLSTPQLKTNINIIVNYLKASFKAVEKINDQSLERVLKEEIMLDEQGYQYECEAKNGKLIYHIKGNKENERYTPQIKLCVNVNTPNPKLKFRQQKVSLTDGVFLEYIDAYSKRTKLVL